MRSREERASLLTFGIFAEIWMRKKHTAVVVRRVNGPRKLRVRVGLRPHIVFVVLILVGAVIAFWINMRFEKAESVYLLYRATHPGAAVPKIDWLTGKVWR